MEFDLNYEYLYCVFENNRYRMSAPERVSDDNSKLLIYYLYELNKATVGVCDKNNYSKILSNCNVCCICFEKAVVIFKTIGTVKENCIVNEMEGIVFDIDQIKIVWYYLEELIAFIHTDLFYDLEDVKTVTQEDLKQIDVRFFDGTIFDSLFREIKECFVPHSFIFSCIDPKIQGIKYYANNIVNVMCKSDNKWKNLSNILSIKGIKSISKKIIGEIYYELPSMKNRPKQDTYLKERKIIKQQIKENKVFWFAQYMHGHVNKRKALTCLENENMVEFLLIEKKLD